MANFCNKCGSPVSGVFCIKCGADTRVAANPPQPAAIAPKPAAAVSKFCNKCGAPASGTTFCNTCGASVRQAAAPASQPASIPVAQAPPPPFAAGQPQSMPAAQAPAKGSPLVKILVGFLIVVVVFGALAAGGVYYVVYRVKKKVHEVAAQIPGVGSSSSSGSIFNSDSNNSGGSGGSGSNGGISGDACRFLSKEEVGRAIGVEIVATQTADGGCTYLAKGNSGDMTAKHLSSMVAGKGADAQTQKMIQGFAGGMINAMQSDNHQQTSDSNGNVPVFTFGIDNNSADTQMQLNRKVLGGLGPGAQDIQGIGDQAFDIAGASLMFRKGDKMVRIMYSMCPCGLENVKPLAKQLADRL
jgi:hypothetical protein